MRRDGVFDSRYARNGARRAPSCMTKLHSVFCYRYIMPPKDRRPGVPAHSAGRPLRIAQIAPLIESVPPKKYGGTERVVSALTEGLVRRGHAVTLFASGDSRTDAKLVSVYPRALREARIADIYGLNSWTMLNIGTAYQMGGRFDVIHDHIGYISLPTANLSRKPVLATYHGPFSTLIRRMYQVMNRPRVVSISRSQGAYIHSLPNHIGTVYNGLAMESYPFSPTHDGYLLFVGRISMEKGTHHAIEVAQYLNIPLIIAAKLDTVDLAYYREYIRPKLSNDQIKWIGEVDEAARNRLMSRALAMLHPITWEEPFGLTIIESMACGTPVIAFDRGSMREVIAHGRTGYVVANIDAMIDAVTRVGKINRAECRRHALRHFNAEVMVERYERLYYQLAGGPGI
ncbi:glycosyltransferase family 4 protein [Candidatus Parcubacteria bacterium]|nr:MAG: glycosyltransferase family 4 protein [Candidatus Parcubacteria bacterium]